MVSKIINEFNPDYAVHPGEILEDILISRGIPKGVFAQRCGISMKSISQIINKKQPVTSETAIQFEKVLGVDASIWIALDARFRLHLARSDEAETEEKDYKVMKEWASRFPLTDLKKKNVISNPRDKILTCHELLNFFSVASIDSWKSIYGYIAVAYRRSKAFESSQHAILAWLRVAEVQAEKIETEPYNKKLFEKNLLKIRALTSKAPKHFELKMKELCREAGVALVFVSELPKTRLCGATRWVGRNKALIALTLRYKSDDHFWFSFFHEAGHIVLHDRSRVFIDSEKKLEDRLEDEADFFAKNILVPNDDYDDFVENGSFYKDEIKEFSKTMGIAPGIIVGMLQHDELIDYSWHNKLKRKFEMVENHGQA